MPSIFTLEGPNLGVATPANLSGTTGIRWWKVALVGVGIVGSVFALRELRQRHEDKQYRRPLRGSSMLKTIALESRSPEEFARRVDAWNAAEGKPLPASKLAKAYLHHSRAGAPRAKPAAIERLIRAAHEERLEKREHLWTKMSRGLRGW
jgi:hypothetical protein